MSNVSTFSLMANMFYSSAPLILISPHHLLLSDHARIDGWNRIELAIGQCFKSFSCILRAYLGGVGCGLDRSALAFLLLPLL